MLGTIFRKAQATVDNAIGQIVTSTIVAVPFLVGGGFASAALWQRLERNLGAEQANLIMAGVFLTIGLICAVSFQGKLVPSLP